MRILVESYPYCYDKVKHVLTEGIEALPDFVGNITINYVGYFYNPTLKDCVFILPKVILAGPDRNAGQMENTDDLAEEVDSEPIKGDRILGDYDPEDLVDLDDAKITKDDRDFLYGFAVWIYRAISVFHDHHKDSGVVVRQQIAQMGRGRRKLSNTFLDIILTLIQFNRDNRNFFFFVMRNQHSGFNRINWTKTINTTQPILQDDTPIYMNPVTKKKKINFDEELLVIFFSILNHLGDQYGFPKEIPMEFELIKGKKFKHYLDGYGVRRLRQIKYKYFSDKAVELWRLCYAFFMRTKRINVSSDQKEYLLAKDFHVVFEAIIDELIGDRPLPDGMGRTQEDGKIVDHLYTGESLMLEDNSTSSKKEKQKPKKADFKTTYYIGDSKYYKIGHPIGRESIYKQFTYARNVIQWNLDLFNPEENPAGKRHINPKVRLRDKATEGYNIIPNFFISSKIERPLDYKEHTDRTARTKSQYRKTQFENRLFDRDTLLLYHYDINFLFILSLYARNKTTERQEWKTRMRKVFRNDIRKWLQQDYEFYALAAHPDVNAEAYFKGHFQDTLGKTFRPFENQQIFSLALDNEFPEDNEKLLASLGENFYVVPCELGTDPSDSIQIERDTKGVVKSPAGMGKFLTAMVTGDDSQLQRFLNHTADKYTMRKIPSINFMEVEYLLPMVQGEIDGYYKVERLSFGERTDRETGEKRPCLNFMLGEYIPLGDHKVHIYRGKMQPGELLPYTYVLNLYEGRI